MYLFGTVVHTPPPADLPPPVSAREKLPDLFSAVHSIVPTHERKMAPEVKIPEGNLIER